MLFFFTNISNTIVAFVFESLILNISYVTDKSTNGIYSIASDDYALNAIATFNSSSELHKLRFKRSKGHDLK